MTFLVETAKTNDELRHYGVLGMKWGVRKGRTAEQYQNEYRKASKKLGKIDKKYERRELKTIKLQNKLDRKIDSRFSSKESAVKTASKLNKARRKTYKAAVKGNKWVKRMENEFSKVDIKLSAEDVERGKKYIEAIRLRALR